MVMFGMVMSALINSQSNVVKTFQRISNFLSMNQSDKRKSNQTRNSPPKLSRNLSNNATKNHQKRLQGMIGLLTILGGALILMILLANPSSNENSLAYIFIILNGLQGVFIFIFYVLLREEVLKLLGFRIKSKEQKPSVGQKRSGLTDSSFFDPATPVSERIPDETFFQAISQKSSSNISTKPLHQGSPKLLRNRHVFWKSPTIRPETADGNRGKSERNPALPILPQEKRTVKTTSSVPASFGSAKDPTIEDLRR